MGHENPETARRRARAWYAANREMALAKNREWARANPEKSRAYKARYKDRVRAGPKMTRRQRSFPDAPREHVRLRVAAWRKENPERWASINANAGHVRRARLKGSVAERVDREVVFARDGWVCGICGLLADRDSATVDHIIPIARGGPHTYANVQTAHRLCNLRKHASLPTGGP